MQACIFFSKFQISIRNFENLKLGNIELGITIHGTSYKYFSKGDDDLPRKLPISNESGSKSYKRGGGTLKKEQFKPRWLHKCQSLRLASHVDVEQEVFMKSGQL